MTTPLTWIRSGLYLVAFLLWTLALSLALLPALTTRAGALFAIRLWVSGVMLLAGTLAGIRCRVLGREHIPTGPCIVAAQHQSSFETYRIFLELPRPVFILKRELIWIPIVGWYMARAGLVPIDRSAGAGAMRKMLRGAEAALARGEQVVVFPEGTRVPPGERRPYHPGIAAIYAHCPAPVIPLALDSGPLWGKTRVLKKPGVITLRFLPALPRGLKKDDFLQVLRARIEGQAPADTASMEAASSIP